MAREAWVREGVAGSPARARARPGAPGTPGAPGAVIAPPTTVTGLTQNLIKIPELFPSNNEKKL
jgi:hypothetical protein